MDYNFLPEQFFAANGLPTPQSRVKNAHVERQRQRAFMAGIRRARIENSDTIRVLYLPNGGARLIGIARFLMELEKTAGVPLHCMFDAIVASSGGGPLAVALATPYQGNGVLAADEIFELYKQVAQTLLTRDRLAALKEGAFHASGLKVQKAFRELWGDQTLNDAFCHLMISTHACQDTLSGLWSRNSAERLSLFINNDHPNLFQHAAGQSRFEDGSAIPVADIAAAAVAIPVAFPGIHINGKRYRDGAFNQNGVFPISDVLRFIKSLDAQHKMLGLPRKNVVLMGLTCGYTTQTTNAAKGRDQAIAHFERLKAISDGRIQGRVFHTLFHDLVPGISEDATDASADNLPKIVQAGEMLYARHEAYILEHMMPVLLGQSVAPVPALQPEAAPA